MPMADTHDDTPADDVTDWIGWTTRQQSLASDPSASAWVSANAGAGKTHVLTQRVIRLLLSGVRPSSILCLTYTKAAASEMSGRVFARLAEWATMPDGQLRARIEAIEGKDPDLLKLAEARRLFARALETPGGLKIQTIHAFCEALLHQFPLEANVAGHFTVLDERGASVLIADARRALLTASGEEDGALAAAVASVLDLADETGLDRLLELIVANRSQIRTFLREAQDRGGPDAALRIALGLDPLETEDSIAEECWPLPGLEGAELQTWLDAADRHGGANVEKIAYALREAMREPDPTRRIAFLEAAFLKQDGGLKAMTTLATKAMIKAVPELPDRLALATDHFMACRDRLRLMRMHGATMAALVLADRLIGDYEDLKRQRSLLDFEDLIERAATLLTRDSAGPWVHYKLDQGIDHILVDEAQDTSPVQWSIIRSLAADFFAGHTARRGLRTMFAVGDEKQSIYSFQGARPERFSRERKDTQREVTAAGQDFHAVRLSLSFRSTADVLSAVDQVFMSPENARGLSDSGDDVIHQSNRSNQPGLVELWEMIAPDIPEDEEDWTAPYDAINRAMPAAILASRIAGRVADMIGNETIVHDGKTRPITPGDILVLVRKRDGFVNALTRELKNRRNIPVAGADRLKLPDHIAVQDLLALGRFVLLPQDDLSLCAVLKSPLFDHDEDDIFELAARRGPDESVWQRMTAHEDQRFAQTRRKLETFIALARSTGVNGFYTSVLATHGGRRQFLARLGSEASDVMDEFVSFTFDHEQNGQPGLQSFITTLENDAPEVKREQGKNRDEIRIMTVHASKGLEAPVVFLVDGGSQAFVHAHLPKLRMLPGAAGAVPAWLPDKRFANTLTSEDEARIRKLTEEEYRRLLYVAMTRAADRLVVCGYRGSKENPDCWHAMISRSLAGDETRHQPETFRSGTDTWEGLSWTVTPRMENTVHGEPGPDNLTVPERALPPALGMPLPPLKSLPRPLSPSGAGTIIDDGAEDLLVTSPLFGEKPAKGSALQRGRFMHRMLQTLPDFPTSERRAAAERYMERAARFWPTQQRRMLVTSVMDILEHPELGEVFSQQGMAEVSIMGTMELSGQSWAVSGRVDRMVALDDRVIIVDYKTNRVPPEDLSAVPFAHKAQLSIYREILTPLYPGKDILCALVYTESARVIPIPADEMRETLAAIRTK